MILDQLRLGVEEQLLIFSASCLSPGRVKKLLIFFMLHIPLDSIIDVGYCCWWSLALGELCLLGYPIMTIPV